MDIFRDNLFLRTARTGQCKNNVQYISIWTFSRQFDFANFSFSIHTVEKRSVFDDLCHSFFPNKIPMLSPLDKANTQWGIM